MTDYTFYFTSGGSVGLPVGFCCISPSLSIPQLFKVRGKQHKRNLCIFKSTLLITKCGKTIFVRCQSSQKSQGSCKFQSEISTGKCLLRSLPQLLLFELIPRGMMLHDFAHYLQSLYVFIPFFLKNSNDFLEVHEKMFNVAVLIHLSEIRILSLFILFINPKRRNFLNAE